MSGYRFPLCSFPKTSHLLWLFWKTLLIVKGGVQVNHNLNLERLSTRVKKEDKEWLLDYMHETRSHSLGEAIGRLIEEKKSHTQSDGQVSASELSAEFRAVDFQTKVITELLNHMINTLQIDRVEEQVVLTSKAKTFTLRAAEKLINEKLNNRF